MTDKFYLPKPLLPQTASARKGHLIHSSGRAAICIRQHLGIPKYLDPGKI